MPDNNPTPSNTEKYRMLIGRKYAITVKKGSAPSSTLYPIQALRDITRFGVKKGDIGGYIEWGQNLSQDPNSDAWISYNAKVYGNASVTEHAYVSGYASVSGAAQISGFATVSGVASVRGDARVSGLASVSGDAEIAGEIHLSGEETVSDGSHGIRVPRSIPLSREEKRRLANPPTVQDWNDIGAVFDRGFDNYLRK